MLWRASLRSTAMSSCAKRKIYALLGRNGAGKTTTMKMLLNLVKPTSGFIKIFNDIHLEDASKRIAV